VLSVPDRRHVAAPGNRTYRVHIMNPRIAVLPRPLRLAAVLALAFAYLSQALPHAHAEAHHPDPHPAPIAHSHAHDHHHHHAHAPETHEADHGPSGPGRHHHEIARHLDVHFLRDVQIATDHDHLGPPLPAAVPALPNARPATERIATAPTAPSPPDPLLPHAPSRAPPA
jgi:hypothetical protein